MKTYKDKNELKSEIKISYEKYICEFLNIPENFKDIKNPKIDRTPMEKARTLKY